MEDGRPDAQQAHLYFFFHKKAKILVDFSLLDIQTGIDFQDLLSEALMQEERFYSEDAGNHG